MGAEKMYAKTPETFDSVIISSIYQYLSFTDLGKFFVGGKTIDNTILP